jgi:hypothetical protein
LKCGKNFASLDPKVEFGLPVHPVEISQAERVLGVKLPDRLRSLLLETNGTVSEYGSALVWPLKRIRDDNRSFRENREFRRLYMPFESLLLFADAGSGDQFFYPIVGGEIRRPDVFVWNHEDDSRQWVAPSLQIYFEWWFAEKLKY